MEIHPLTALHQKTQTQVTSKMFLFEIKVPSRYLQNTAQSRTQRCVPCPGCLRAPQIHPASWSPSLGQALHAWWGKGGALTARWPDPHTGLRVPEDSGAPSPPWS